MPSRFPFYTALLLASGALILSSCEMMSSGGTDDEETVPTGDLDLQTVSSRFHLGISWWP
ncbi:MAG: hypothetical protein HKN17_04190 [Rhodothermales bacterium]|nr:hypothetical protein [Rhodothermales bacterium]